jgi:hypothetical protein
MYRLPLQRDAEAQRTALAFLGVSAPLCDHVFVTPQTKSGACFTLAPLLVEKFYIQG